MPELRATGYASLVSIVVVRGLEPTGFLGSTVVPVVTERWVTQNVERCNGLSALHELARTRPDQKALAAEWEQTVLSAKLAGYELRTPGIGRRVRVGRT
jgi:hypothetical protein